LDEMVLASPALAHGQIFIRGDKHLFCIGANGKAPTGKVNAPSER
jgi:hypothetical protein